ncbi:hypothetical protein PED38_15410 [Clavibacter sp. CT19]|uniref:hypothetical protein n=1 Tax=Clavibacter sp. CT19 TaxID=3018990 RepID=UPI0022EB8DF5|nr:hypothetical protein [Clavibacter sp. CT19]MDA3806187.1 hypothetical protein [Clavibacter sp. CT19]
MDDETGTESFTYSRTADGDVVLLPAGHEERMRDLTAHLIRIGPDEDALTALLTVKRDPDLERGYALAVVVEAVELAASYAIREMEAAIVPLFTRRLHRLILATRT